MTPSNTNTAAREYKCEQARFVGWWNCQCAECRQRAAENTLGSATLTQQQGGEQEVSCGHGDAFDASDCALCNSTALRTKQPAASDSLRGLRNEEGMLSGAELESLIDAAQTTTDNKPMAFLGQVARDLLQQLHGVESALLAVGKRPPLCDTENAVRFAVGMP